MNGDVVVLLGPLVGTATRAQVNVSRSTRGRTGLPPRRHQCPTRCPAPETVPRRAVAEVDRLASKTADAAASAVVENAAAAAAAARFAAAAAATARVNAAAEAVSAAEVELAAATAAATTGMASEDREGGTR